ncbi:hypothetical protein BDR07DRAFT_1484048 [Suillus spraguei]|nr:hypothetical protein BDR07DRAFT_1484048 [Suillus spraguei]
MSIPLQMSRPTDAHNSPSKTSSRLIQAPDQFSMKRTLQSNLDYLNQPNERMINTYREMLDIRARITELLASCQSDVTAGDWVPSSFFVIIQNTATRKLQAIAVLLVKLVVHAPSSTDFLKCPRILPRTLGTTPATSTSNLKGMQATPCEFGMCRKE